MYTFNTSSMQHKDPVISVHKSQDEMEKARKDYLVSCVLVKEGARS
jgi:hypothetical protein